MNSETQSSKSWYDSKPWLVYLLCVLFFPVGLFGLWKSKVISNPIKWTITIVIAVLFIFNLSKGDKNSTSSNKVEAKAEVEAGAEPESNWETETTVDKMTNQTNSFTTIKSENEVDFSFPYSGGSKMLITVREMGRGPEVVIRINKGQFIPSLGGNDNPILVKFDDNQPENFYHNMAADGNPETIFLTNSEDFVKGLKNSKKVTIRALFYQDGNKDFEFNVAGFKLPSK